MGELIELRAKPEWKIAEETVLREVADACASAATKLPDESRWKWALTSAGQEILSTFTAA